MKTLSGFAWVETPQAISITSRSRGFMVWVFDGVRGAGFRVGRAGLGS